MSSKSSTDSSVPAAADAPLIIVGGGLSGLTAAYEITKAGQKCIIIEQENEANLGGQAFWSLGGIFLVGTSNKSHPRPHKGYC